MMFCQFRDFIYRDAQMIEPFFRNFLTCTLFHRFLHIIARYVCKEAVNPYTDLIFLLPFELSLPVDRPA